MIRHPFSKTALLFSLLLLLGASGRAASADVILVTAAKNPIDELDTREVQSLYKGRLTSIKGKPLKPLNAAPGSIERKEFLNQMMKLNELDYTGYWHVRRYSGQGTPPLEVASQDELFDLLKKQPEGIGYLWVPPGAKLELPEGLKVIKVR
jgi:hypothetical protein